MHKLLLILLVSSFLRAAQTHIVQGDMTVNGLLTASGASGAVKSAIFKSTTASVASTGGVLRLGYADEARWLASGGSSEIAIGLTAQNEFKVSSGVFASGPLRFVQLPTPGNPASGTMLIYPKTDRRFYTKDLDGNERTLGDFQPSAHVAWTVASIVSGLGIVKFDSVTWDTTTAYASATGLFTAPTAGKYQVTAMLAFNGATFAVNDHIILKVYKNGSLNQWIQDYTLDAAATLNKNVNGTATITCAAGDTIAVWAYSTTAVTANQETERNWVTFQRLSD